MNGEERINEVINNFLEQFDCDAEMGSDFCYYYDEETIEYSLVIGTLSDEVWTIYVESTFGYTIQDIFVFSLLHEVGHHFTMDNFTNEEHKTYNRKVKKIESALSKSDSDLIDKGYYMQYFDLPVEKVATEWAVKYARRNRKKLKAFRAELQEALNVFYAENITED